MADWSEVRKTAQAYYARARAMYPDDMSARSLIDAAAAITEMMYVPVAHGDPVLNGGDAVLDREAWTIWYDVTLAPHDAVFYIAHEYAHFWLDDDVSACTSADIDAEADEEPLPVGIRRVEGYGPEEHRECAANVFAREYLLPAPFVRRLHRDEGLAAKTIAERVGLPTGMVYHQLARALLVPGQSPGDTTGANAEEALLDLSQEKAARASHGPLLIEAGPGTGKTRTLVSRIVFLIKQGVPTSRIIALTYSNKAAEEMRARIALAAPEAVGSLWVGTFHAFGLELLRKWGTRLGLPPRLAVLDPADTFFLLERALPDLDLDYYQNLYEPTTYLRDILAAISRAKDDLVGPARYRELAEEMDQAATTDEERKAAGKACEVARLYALYQQLLAGQDALDFGDLIFRAVDLLRTFPDVRTAVRDLYSHVLVDEYQDVNRASALLLREIAGTGEGLWVVGDARQAIYRFRGAAPINMQLFDSDFHGAARRSLQRNYRSQPAILDVFVAFAPQMRVAGGEAFAPWQPHRSLTDGFVQMAVASDRDAEGDGIAREIRRLSDDGIPYREQAVLCRSHTTLARLALRLERAGIPVLYLGDLFERSEVRDLLALLSLAGEGNGRGLVRVARFVEYAIPLSDVRTLVREARARDIPFPRALSLARDLPAVSPQGQEGFALLLRHLDGICHGTGAWGLLVQYLFDRSAYLHPFLAVDSIADHQRRLAIYQFLQFAHDHRGYPVDRGDEPKRVFLRYVRRLAITGEDRQLRQVPGCAANLDAVRLLTVHASKGLEFRVVFLPALGQGQFPARRQHEPCPPPLGLLGHDRGDDHEEEEECLFFVALSRARDILYLSRARRNGGQTSNPSRLLAAISNSLPQPIDGPPIWEAEDDAPPNVGNPPVVSPVPVFAAELLDLYLKCPRQFFYEYELGLSGRREDSAYVQFHRCVYAVLRWMHDERSEGRSVDESTALAHLAEKWERNGPQDHAYEAIYRTQARLMILRALGRITPVHGRVARPEWVVPLPHGRVTFTPDHVEVSEASGAVPLVQRLRTGRPSKDEEDKDIYALYQVAARAAFPDTSPTVEIAYLSGDVTTPVHLSARKLQNRLDRYDAAIVGIQQGMFSPQPSERECPRCPHYFICPVAEDTAVPSAT